MKLHRANATQSVLRLHMSFNDLLDKATDWVNALSCCIFATIHLKIKILLKCSNRLHILTSISSIDVEIFQCLDIVICYKRNEGGKSHWLFKASLQMFPSPSSCQSWKSWGLKFFLHKIVHILCMLANFMVVRYPTLPSLQMLLWTY